MKIKEFLKKNCKEVLLDILVYLIIAMIISKAILSKGIGNLDELWNYNFARNIANNLIPYKDFNMINTPLLSIIAGVFLKFFTDELIVMRILAIFLNTSIFFTMYKISTKLGMSKKIVAMFLLIWLNIVKDYIAIDYNYGTLLIVLIMIYIELFYRNKTEIKADFKKDILIGVLSGISILFKQTTGLIIFIVAAFYKILLIRNKKEIKEFIKSVVSILIGMLIPVIIMLIYLSSNNAISDFIDYTILGIQTFSNKISYFNLINSDGVLTKVLSILMPITLVTSYIYSVIKNKKEFNTIISYSIGMFAVTFPISDEIHFTIGITAGLIVLMYVLNKLYLFIKEKYKLVSEKWKKKIIIYLAIFCNTFVEIILIVYISLYTLESMFFISQYKAKAEEYTKLRHFKYIEMSDKQLNMIQNVNSYIILNTHDDVYILDSDAAMYMIPLDKYNKDFDMFNKGNFGSKGENGQIEKIKAMKKNTKILIKNDTCIRNWQNPNTVTEYIKGNLNKIGEIEYFDIYVK